MLQVVSVEHLAPAGAVLQHVAVSSVFVHNAPLQYVLSLLGSETKFALHCVRVEQSAFFMQQVAVSASLVHGLLTQVWVLLLGSKTKVGVQVVSDEHVPGVGFGLQHVGVSSSFLHRAPAQYRWSLLESFSLSDMHVVSVLHLARNTQHVVVSAVAVHGLAWHKVLDLSVSRA